MDYKYRTALYKFLDLLPEGAGYYLYHILQKRLSKSGIEIKINEAERSFTAIKAILDKNGISLENSNIVEIGSGWVPLIPYLLVIKGNARRVDTYDVNEHFNTSEIAAVNKYYQAEKYGLGAAGKYKLPEKVHYYPKQDAAQADLGNADLVLSRFVLEHVPPENIRKMHENLYGQLKSGSHILHLISPSDHRAYSDPSLSLVDFLQYSQAEWDSIQTKFDYHNRLRLPQYLDILKERFEILHLDHDCSEPGSHAYAKFKKLNIHQDFAGFSETELTAGSINILLKKK